MSTSMNTRMNMSTMKSAIQQVIYENNEGTRLLRQCQYDLAVKSFTSVLTILKPLAVIVEDKHAAHRSHSHAGNVNDNDNDNIIDADVNTHSSSISLMISFNPTNARDDSDKKRIDDDTTTKTAQTQPGVHADDVDATSSTTNTSSTSGIGHRKLKHFVFRDPVVIATNTDIIDKDESSSFYSPALFSKFLMIVMYNLALTLNLHALSLLSSVLSTSSSLSSNHQTKTKRSNNSKKHIKKLFARSRKLYELSLELHVDDTIDVIDPLFTLALTNNLGLVYLTVNDKVRSRTCFKNMFSTMMMYLLDSSSHSIKEWHELVSNAMDILFKPTYAVTAAAA